MFIYDRPGFNTFYFPISKLLIHAFLCVAGFIFVNLVPNLNKSPKVLWSKKTSYEDFTRLMLIWSPIIFFLTSLITIRSKKDLVNYCKQGAQEANEPFFSSLFESLIPSKLFDHCQYSYLSVLIYNMLSVLGFQLALNLGMLDDWVIGTYDLAT